MKPIFEYSNNAKYSNIRIIGLISAYTGCPRKYTCNCGKASHLDQEKLRKTGSKLSTWILRSLGWWIFQSMVGHFKPNLFCNFCDNRNSAQWKADAKVLPKHPHNREFTQKSECYGPLNPNLSFDGKFCRYKDVLMMIVEYKLKS